MIIFLNLKQYVENDAITSCIILMILTLNCNLITNNVVAYLIKAFSNIKALNQKNMLDRREYYFSLQQLLSLLYQITNSIRYLLHCFREQKDYVMFASTVQI